MSRPNIASFFNAHPNIQHRFLLARPKIASFFNGAPNMHRFLNVAP
jgi:hypothetical protein